MDSKKGSGESFSSDGDESRLAFTNSEYSPRLIEPNGTVKSNKNVISNSDPSFLKAVAHFVSSNQLCISKPNYQIIWLDQSLDSTEYQVYISALLQLNFINLDRVK